VDLASFEASLAGHAPPVDLDDEWRSLVMALLAD
jgi:hypothetical protein